MAINTEAYMQKLLWIKGKDGRLKRLEMNAPQKKLYEALKKQHQQGQPMRVIVLKARQMGFSTLAQALLFKRTMTKCGIRSGIVAHNEEAAQNLYQMAQRMYEYLPADMKPPCSVKNAEQMVLHREMGSSIRVMTAGSEGVGRSETFQNLHLSEVAFWPGDKKRTLAGLMQAVPAAHDTLVVMESTANGFEEFKRIWDRAQRGESEFVPVFCAWWEMQEYRARYSGFTLTQEERELRARYDLDLEQLAWRRWCIQNSCAGDVRMFRQEYPACPEEAFLSTGECIFDKEKLSVRLGQIKKPLMRITPMYRIVQEHGGQRLEPTGIREHTQGSVRVYEMPRPGVPYVIGADTAGDGSDWFAAQVLNNITGMQAAVLHRKYDEDAFACELMALGYWYHTALLGIEANFSTYPIKTVERLGYPRQYMRQVEDSFTQRVQRRWGVRTTAQTRPVMLAELVRLVRENTELLNDAATIQEMLSFVKNERGRAEAMAGSHDDCVMAMAIAHYIRPQQTCVVQAEMGVQKCSGQYEHQVCALLEYGL